MPLLRPAPGLKVIDPTTMVPIPEAGIEVRLNSYWRRRLRDGSVVEVASPRSEDAVEPTRARSDEEPSEEEPRHRRRGGRPRED